MKQCTITTVTLIFIAAVGYPNTCGTVWNSLGLDINKMDFDGRPSVNVDAIATSTACYRPNLDRWPPESNRLSVGASELCKLHRDCTSRSWDIVVTRCVRTNERTYAANGKPENNTFADKKAVTLRRLWKNITAWGRRHSPASPPLAMRLSPACGTRPAAISWRLHASAAKATTQHFCQSQSRPLTVWSWTSSEAMFMASQSANFSCWTTSVSTVKTEV